MKILYITKLSDSKSNGVTIAVIQLLNSICEQAEIFWLDLSNHDFDVNSNVKKVTSSNYLDVKPDIVVFEDPFNTIKFCFVAWKLKKANIPYIISPHGCFHKKALAKHALKKKIAMNTLFRSFLKNALAYQFLNSDEEINSYNNKRSIVIPNGINSDVSQKIHQEVKRIVFIGRKDVNTKGLDILLQACCLIKQRVQKVDFKIDLYGPEYTKKDSAYINEMITNEHLDLFVTNHGPVFDGEKRNILLESDCFILTSRHEGFPMSILEALAYGLPVLVTNGTNVGELIESNNCGWVSESNVEQIAELIIKVTNCNIEEQSRNARKLACLFSWSNVSKTTVSEYNRILGEKNETRNSNKII